MKILIIGSGVIGLSIGWQLARRQWEVHIFDKQSACSEASWTAAGMLAPYAELGCQAGRGLEVELGRKSLALYPQFLRELNEDAQAHLKLERAGTLFVGIDKDDQEILERLFMHQTRNQFPAERLTGREARAIEPLLSPRVCAALWIPGDTHIQNQQLLIALKRAFQQRGGKIHEHCPIESLWIQKGSLKGIYAGQSISCGTVINTAGAWSGSFSKEYPVAVSPNKGQILTLSMAQGEALTYMIRTPRVYLVPKNDGNLRIGATNEHTGFDRRVTGGAVLELLRDAFEVVPAIGAMEFCKAEANFRPAGMECIPRIEESSLKGYFLAVGHGRAGILLAPYTAYKMVEKLCISK